MNPMKVHKTPRKFLRVVFAATCQVWPEEDRDSLESGEAIRSIELYCLSVKLKGIKGWKGCSATPICCLFWQMKYGDRNKSPKMWSALYLSPSLSLCLSNCLQRDPYVEKPRSANNHGNELGNISTPPIWALRWDKCPSQQLDWNLAGDPDTQLSFPHNIPDP